MEKWKTIDGYEGIYQVSNQGRVKSLSRKVPHARHGFVSVKEKILKPDTNHDGYARVGLCKEGLNSTHKVHRLVATAFLQKKDDGNVVNHIDGNKSNNSVKNLEWVTQSENVLHSYQNGLQKPLRGELNGNSKLTQELVNQIRSTYKFGEFGLKKTADMFGVSKRNVLDIIKYRIWK